jgi:4-hydroxy-tetrahydrodipicolinate synthase
MDSAAITGLGTALLTPFRADGALDMARLEAFIQFQIEGGVNFLVPCGTTGETPTLSDEEQVAVIQATLRIAKGRVPVVAGCTSYDTRHVVEMGKRFQSIGVTHVLSATPYYNKPTQEGIYRHFKMLRQETGLEIMLYSIQGRTGVNAAPETVARLAEERIIFAVKEASGNILQMQQICQRVNGALKVFSGDDAMALPLMAVGGEGVVSVASNVVPRAMRAWVDTMTERNYVKARGQLKTLLPLFEALFVETNPIPAKGAAAILGLMEAHFRLPMVPPAEKTMAGLRQALAPFMNA